MNDSLADSRFTGGFPDQETIRAAYDAANSARAIVCYKHFFPLVSGARIFSGQLAVGAEINRVFGYMDTRPAQAGLTLNSDTPYAGPFLDLRVGPLVVELPAGVVFGAVLNYDQSWVTDLGVPGRDGGNGGAYLILPPHYDGPVPEEFFVARAQSFKIVVGLRGVPIGGDVAAAIELLKTVRIRPLDPEVAWEDPEWLDMSGAPQDTSPVPVEAGFEYWETLHAALQDEPARAGDTAYESELAALGIQRGRPFTPDEHLRGVLTRAAAEADAQMRVQSLADRREDRVVWADRLWEWVTLRPENADFEIDGRTDVVARETWFFQAIATSPAMFRRVPGGGSLYWFTARDGRGEYLDGAHAYTLRVPLPAPAGLFWSVTVYDAITRSQILTDRNSAALRSLFELTADPAAPETVLRFGPTEPADGPERWIKTIPGRGWFAYLRLYAPTQPAFDGSWRPGDIARA
ncbi:DUF1214 domain-containing protein [Leucobacter luti]|uniref:DUF1254 domain-containing protein n=1 Tax=Leucobacter luti TaxID=340320 RepID=A0A4Q7U4S3_9MICO|nr:DUF1214 domain-containing protein [Leucobacter luti]MBL3700511.1 DUF1254 domain-containing protein [Leucobacter luti]RZT68655.1 hypothetical protein EV139_0381 [Leucobacter luti]